MKVYIDLQKLAISKVVDGTSPEYTGDINSNVFEILFFNYDNTNWFPTMSQLAPNGRQAGDFEADSLGVGETHDYTEDGVNYQRFTFTMGSAWVLMKGRSNLFIWYNVLDGAVIKKCVGKLNVMLNESDDNYFISNPTFNPAVKDYIDGLASDIEDELNDKVDAQNATIASLSQASPSVFDTAANIQLLQENKGVAVATDTGYIWYWDSTLTTPAYVSSGLQYNSLANYVKHTNGLLKDTNNNVITISKLNMPYEVVNKTYTLTSGKYINADGGISNADQYKYTSTISLSKGEMVEFYGYGYSTNVAIISTIISGQRLPQVISIDNSLRYYQFMAVEDCEICVSYRDIGTADLRFYTFGDYTAINNNCAYAIDEIKSKSYTLSSNVVWNTGKYINAVGGMSNSDQTQYSDPIQFNKGDIVVIHARGFDSNVAMISIYENGKYTPVVISDDRNWKDYTYYCGSDCYLVFCTYTWANFTNARIFKSNFMKKYHDYINYEINKINLDFNERDYFDFAVFENIGVVGDSYASGYIDNSSKYNLSWLQIMARNLGVTGYNFSAGGMTTETWLTDTNRGLPYLLNTQKCGLYFLSLGINDYINGGTSYLGTIADINDNDPSQNANSFYGNYGKIISYIKNYSPSSRLVLLTIARDSTIPTSYNNAIIEIANHFNIPYIVQLDDWYFKSTIYNNMINGHPTALGYSGMSKALQRLLTKCVINNFDYFKNYIGVS